jgi:formylglycine-generating enzyme required for sulfatase activity/serine/threonine protein kinase
MRQATGCRWHSPQEVAQMSLPVALSQQFGRYRIVETLGVGAMGLVFLAEDSLLSRRVALKLPHYNGDVDVSFRDRFLREARVAAAIDHPNVCPIYDIGEHHGVPYLVMPVIAGTPLSKLIVRDQPWCPERAVDLVQRLALAVEAAHARGVIHRDLKPANIIIRNQDEPTVMDFGLAQLINKQGRRLSEQSVLGTPDYMAPEQIQNASAIGPATDVYSLGVIFYELLTGRRPFESEGPLLALFNQILTGRLAPPSSLRPGLEPWFDAVCLKALARKPEDRYASMKIFAQELSPSLPVTVLSRDPEGPLPVLRLHPVKDVDLDPARTMLLQVRVTRQHCKGPIELRLGGLPDQVSVTRGLISADSDRGVLKLKAEAGMAPGPMTGRVLALAAEVRAEASVRVTVRPPRLKRELVNSLGMTFLAVPAGRFVMGSQPDERHRCADEEQHEVEITSPFYLGAYPVTQQEYERVMGTKPSDFSATGSFRDRVAGMDTRHFPVDSVSWEDAREFCKRLSELPEEKKHGRAYRLPTEAEWERACRGGTAASSPFGIGDCISVSSDVMNCDGNYPYGEAAKGTYLMRTCPVGSYRPNALGLFDMHGNIWEWCEDRYGAYDDTILRDPFGPATGERRVLRGGSWNDLAWDCRSACRLRFEPSIRLNYVGFRVLCVGRAP